MDGNTEEISRLLKVLIGLQVRENTEGPVSLKDQITTLDELGLKPFEIAQALGKSPNHVNKELSVIRKAKKK